MNFITRLAKKDGFKVTNYDNYIVEVEEGEGDKNITIMAHTDIVPVGTGWEHDPFEVFEAKGVLYGRGVSDDKGPLLSSYYALKLLRDNHLLGDYRVRLLVGGNEESGSRCMEHYFQTLKKEEPTLGFSPDADFPLIYAEKGIVNFEVSSDFSMRKVKSIHGGIASNSVIEKCDVLMDYDPHFVAYLKENKIKCDIEKDGDSMKVSFVGKAAHGSIPHEGINAGIIAITSLAYFYESPELSKIALCYNDPFGKGINAYNESKEMGKNSMNVGIIDYENNHFSMIVNFRYVDGVDIEQTMNNIKEVNKPFSINEQSRAPLLYYPKDSALVSTLLKVYQEETGDTKTEPLAIGGGTYAKETSNSVAFGLTFPGEEPHMHSPKENIKKNDLFMGIGIYAHAIIELGKKL